MRVATSTGSVRLMSFDDSFALVPSRAESVGSIEDVRLERRRCSRCRQAGRWTLEGSVKKEESTVGRLVFWIREFKGEDGSQNAAREPRTNRRRTNNDDDEMEQTRARRGKGKRRRKRSYYEMDPGR